MTSPLHPSTSTNGERAFHYSFETDERTGSAFAVSLKVCWRTVGIKLTHVDASEAGRQTDAMKVRVLFGVLSGDGATRSFVPTYHFPPPLHKYRVKKGAALGRELAVRFDQLLQGHHEEILAALRESDLSARDRVRAEKSLVSVFAKLKDPEDLFPDRRLAVDPVIDPSGPIGPPPLSIGKIFQRARGAIQPSPNAHMR